MADSAYARQLQGKSKVAFPFASGWANTAVAGVEGATYSRHGRTVILQGAVTKTSGAPAGGNLIGTLPVGYRPTGYHYFAVVTGPSVNTFGVIEVGSNGEVKWTTGAAGETDLTSLSGITFVVD